MNPIGTTKVLCRDLSVSDHLTIQHLTHTFQFVNSSRAFLTLVWTIL